MWLPGEWAPEKPGETRCNKVLSAGGMLMWVCPFPDLSFPIYEMGIAVITASNTQGVQNVTVYKPIMDPLPSLSHNSYGGRKG